MKKCIMATGGYLLAGAITCIAFAAVAGNMEEDGQKPAEVKAPAAEIASAAASGDDAAATAKPRSRRGRKAKRSEAAEKKDASAPRKPRARRGRKAKADQDQERQD